MNAADYPAPVVFSREDIDRALAGAFITKVVYLEHPDQASAAVSRPDQPFEMEVEPGHDPVNAARSVGRPMLIVRFGGREQDPKELARQAIPGTVLLPGEKTLPRPVRPPCIPCVCVPLVDPILGPRPAEEECLHDGGDAGLKAGIGPDGKLHGLDPADAVAEYTDSQGRRHVKPSNRVCICVPRFGVLRTMIATAGFDAAFAIDAARNAVAQANVEARWPSKVAVQSMQLQAVKSKQRPSATTMEFGLHDIEQVQANAIVVGMMHGDAVVGTVLKKPQEQPDRPLVLTKSADKQAAQIGDVITFTLKYSNPGGQPITNVAVSDSLTGRLEYVSGSARSDRDATFTFQPNSASSMILRWEVNGRLFPFSRSGLLARRPH